MILFFLHIKNLSPKFNLFQLQMPSLRKKYAYGNILGYIFISIFLDELDLTPTEWGRKDSN